MKLIAIAAGLALAAANGPVPELPAATSLWFRADVTITPQGRATDLAWRNYTEMPEDALADLERRIAGWKFRPGTVDSEPVATGTSLVIHVVAVERPDGRFVMEVANAVPGPSLVGPIVGARSSPYREIVTGGSLKSGHVILDATFDPGRDAVIDILDFETSIGHRRYRSALDREARWMVRQWKVHHETLAGEPLPARFRLVHRYCLGGDWCDGNEPDSMAGLSEMPPGQPVPMGSVVQLLSDVATVRLRPDGLPEAGDTH
jgi:hypothetical protein